MAYIANDKDPDQTASGLILFAVTIKVSLGCI